MRGVILVALTLVVIVCFCVDGSQGGPNKRRWKKNRKAYLEFRNNKRQMKKQARKAEANQSLKRTLQAAVEVTTEKPMKKCWLAPIDIKCNPEASYRTIDGSCNNLKHPTWGQSIRPMARFLPSLYEHGTDGLIRETGVNGRPLPSTRKVSTTIHELASNKDLSEKLTNMHMLWGQFIDHDLGHTPLIPKMKCCNKPKSERPDDCIPIPVPRDDPFWSTKTGINTTCMELRRSMAVDENQCDYLVQREQLNNVTSPMDGSAIYGSDEKRAKALRAYQGGLLKTSDGGYLPLEKPHAPKTHDCNIPTYATQDRRCFAAGDKRSNVWSGLTAIHELFVKEHNRVAKTFYQVIGKNFPLLSDTDLDELAFQEARRITGAQFQAINYKEYLPPIFGEAGMRKWRLNLGLNVPYNPKVDITISNVFSTAAFRFGHAQIPFGNQPKSSDYTNTTRFVKFTETFNQPFRYRTPSIGFENTLRGTIVEAALNSDPKFSDEVRNKLFARSFNNSGLDLPAVNNQRGREHGIPPYNEWREYCGLERVDFNYMPDHTDELRLKFASIYSHPDDIDLFSAGLSERFVSKDALIGPTFSCLLGLQLNNLKEGDRFWFENQGTYPNSFTDEQIYQLSQVTLSKVICDNTDTEYVPANSFRLDSPFVRCDELPALNLRNWFKLY